MGFVDPGSNEQTSYGGVGKHSKRGFVIEHIRQHTTGGSKSREGKLAGPIRIPFKLKLVSGGAILAWERF